MRFPQTFIDDLRRQADIVRIVQDYVSLKKTGANWVARCPFHKETKPSFSVNPAKEIFYCFGCQKGGSVFNFIMEIERVTFPEAIKIVAEKSGVPLPKMVEDSRFEARQRESDQVIELNQWALSWWDDANTLVTVVTSSSERRFLVEPGSEPSVLRGRARSAEKVRCVPYRPVTHSRDDVVTLTTSCAGLRYVTIRQ